MDDPSTLAELFVGAKTDAGVVRSRNEDAIFVEPTSSADAAARGWLGIVADGLGGHRNGDVASKLAVQTTRDRFYGSAIHGDTPGRLRSAVEGANHVILTSGDHKYDNADMASTITAAVVEGTKLTVAQVGDSRGYLIRNSRMRQITHDHSLVDQLIRDGKITPEEAQHHPNRNVITRALGTHESVEVDLFEEELHDGDVVLLCSDGLYRVVEESEMARALIAEPQHAANTLVALANQRGAPDNVSVVLVRVSLKSDDDEITLPGALSPPASVAEEDGEITLVRPRLPPEF